MAVYKIICSVGDCISANNKQCITYIGYTTTTFPNTYVLFIIQTSIKQ